MTMTTVLMITMMMGYYQFKARSSSLSLQCEYADDGDNKEDDDVKEDYINKKKKERRRIVKVYRRLSVLPAVSGWRRISINFPVGLSDSENPSHQLGFSVNGDRNIYSWFDDLRKFAEAFNIWHKCMSQAGKGYSLEPTPVKSIRLLPMTLSHRVNSQSLWNNLATRLLLNHSVSFPKFNRPMLYFLLQTFF